MIRVIYDGNRMLSGNLECSFCGRADIKLPGNVQIVVQNGVTRTHPSARGVVTTTSMATGMPTSTSAPGDQRLARRTGRRSTPKPAAFSRADASSCSLTARR